MQSIARDQDLINAELRTLLDRELECRNPLHESMRCAVLNGGKRIRPIIAIRIARFLDAELPHTIKYAAAIELIHCASLVIDDLPCMDDALLRRGAPSVHAAFGESTAILAALGLIFLGLRSLVQQPADNLDARKLAQFQSDLLLSLGSNGLVGGQFADLLWRRNNVDRKLACNLVSKAHELKTTPLFVAAIHAGCMFANLSKDRRQMLLGFGRKFGIAFQTKDDLDDRDPAELSALRSQIDEATDSLKHFKGDISQLTEIVACFLSASAN